MHYQREAIMTLNIILTWFNYIHNISFNITYSSLCILYNCIKSFYILLWFLLLSIMLLGSSEVEVPLILVFFCCYIEAFCKSLITLCRTSTHTGTVSDLIMMMRSGPHMFQSWHFKTNSSDISWVWCSDCSHNDGAECICFVGVNHDTHEKPAPSLRL